VSRLSVADLVANAPIDPEAHLDAARVERYAGTLDALPPLVVFDTRKDCCSPTATIAWLPRGAADWRR